MRHPALPATALLVGLAAFGGLAPAASALPPGFRPAYGPSAYRGPVGYPPALASRYYAAAYAGYYNRLALASYYRQNLAYWNSLSQRMAYLNSLNAVSPFRYGGGQLSGTVGGGPQLDDNGNAVPN
jgi:hypothetical protein